MQTCFGSAQRSSAMCSEVAAGEGGSEELLEGVVDWGGALEDAQFRDGA